MKNGKGKGKDMQVMWEESFEVNWERETENGERHMADESYHRFNLPFSLSSHSHANSSPPLSLSPFIYSSIFLNLSHFRVHLMGQKRDKSAEASIAAEVACDVIDLPRAIHYSLESSPFPVVSLSLSFSFSIDP